MPASAATANAQRTVLDWFAANARPFPWRATRDPYATLVAEVMLQQTQTGRVGPIYEAFLKRFPSVETLARAPAMEVIQAWKGLGYNRRAVDLHRAAQEIVRVHGGAFPSDQRVLQALPGVGEYTASALACFAFDAQVAVVDVNVRRVLGRAALGDAGVPVAAARALAREWLPAGHAYEWNQALMDVGATLCRIQTPLCAPCPLSRACAFRRSGGAAAAPVPRVPKQSRFEGSRRQKRGGIVDHLRAAARKGIALGDLAAKMHPGDGRDLSWLVEILTALEQEGLATMTPAARRGSPRGMVRLPG